MKKKHYIIPIFVPHEGCPHNCVFCNQDSITGSSCDVTEEFVEKTILEYLKTIDKENSIIEVSFFGGTFTAIDMDKQKRLLSVAKAFKERKEIDYIRLSTRPDYIDESILTNLKEHSVDIIELGVQSLDEEVLRKSGRGHTESDVVTATKLIKAFGFVIGHQIMIGLPGDDFHKDIMTAKKIIELAPSLVRIYPSLVIKNTPMETMLRKGSYKPYGLEEALKVSKILFGMFFASGINVIRIGLQPTEEINSGKDIIAGPFHPAFRELVEGSILNDMLLKEILLLLKENALNYSGNIEIKINNRDISKLYCNKKEFFNDMKKHFTTKQLKVSQDGDIAIGSILLTIGEIQKKLSVYEFMLQKYKKGYTNLL